MAEITQLLREARDGDAAKLNAVFETVYPELKRLAAAASSRHPGPPMTATALVHSTYLKLIQADAIDIRDRRHFFNCAARAMRQILVDHFRARSSDKRGGGLHRVTLPYESPASSPESWIDLDMALDALNEIDPDLRELVEFRFFAGLTEGQLAELRGCSMRTIQRAWRRARALLYAMLDDQRRSPRTDQDG